MYTDVSLKIDKIDLKTQEICSFILQKGCNLGQQKKAVLTELPFSKALHSCPLLLFIVRRPRQIHEEQRQRGGRQEAQDIIFFAQQGREGAGDDVPVGIIEEIEVGVKGLIQKVDGQSRTEQERQHLRHPPGTGTVAARHQQDWIEYQQGMDTDGVQIDERPPRGDIQPAGAEQCQHCTRDTEGIQLLFAPVSVRDRVVQTDEDIDIAQVQGQIAPIPLAGQGHPQQKGSFVQQEQSGDSD